MDLVAALSCWEAPQQITTVKKPTKKKIRSKFNAIFFYLNTKMKFKAAANLIDQDLRELANLKAKILKETEIVLASTLRPSKSVSEEHRKWTDFVNLASTRVNKEPFSAATIDAQLQHLGLRNIRNLNAMAADRNRPEAASDIVDELEGATVGPTSENLLNPIKQSLVSYTVDRGRLWTTPRQIIDGSMRFQEEPMQQFVDALVLLKAPESYFTQPKIDFYRSVIDVPIRKVNSTSGEMGVARALTRKISELNEANPDLVAPIKAVRDDCLKKWIVSKKITRAAPHSKTCRCCSCTSRDLGSQCATACATMKKLQVPTQNCIIVDKMDILQRLRKKTPGHIHYFYDDHHQHLKVGDFFFVRTNGDIVRGVNNTYHPPHVSSGVPHFGADIKQKAIDDHVFWAKLYDQSEYMAERERMENILQSLQHQQEVYRKTQNIFHNIKNHINGSVASVPPHNIEKHVMDDVDLHMDLNKKDRDQVAVVVRSLIDQKVRNHTKVIRHLYKSLPRRRKSKKKATGKRPTKAVRRRRQPKTASPVKVKLKKLEKENKGKKVSGVSTNRNLKKCIRSRLKKQMIEFQNKKLEKIDPDYFTWFVQKQEQRKRLATQLTRYLSQFYNRPKDTLIKSIKSKIKTEIGRNIVLPSGVVVDLDVVSEDLINSHVTLQLQQRRDALVENTTKICLQEAQSGGVTPEDMRKMVNIQVMRLVAKGINSDPKTAEELDRKDDEQTRAEQDKSLEAAKAWSYKNWPILELVAQNKFPVQLKDSENYPRYQITPPKTIKKDQRIQNQQKRLHADIFPHRMTCNFFPNNVHMNTICNHWIHAEWNKYHPASEHVNYSEENRSANVPERKLQDQITDYLKNGTQYHGDIASGKLLMDGDGEETKKMREYLGDKLFNEIVKKQKMLPEYLEAVKKLETATTDKDKDSAQRLMEKTQFAVKTDVIDLKEAKYKERKALQLERETEMQNIADMEDMEDMEQAALIESKNLGAHAEYIVEYDSDIWVEASVSDDSSTMAGQASRTIQVIFEQADWGDVKNVNILDVIKRLNNDTRNNDDLIEAHQAEVQARQDGESSDVSFEPKESVWVRLRKIRLSYPAKEILFQNWQREMLFLPSSSTVAKHMKKFKKTEVVDPRTNKTLLSAPKQNYNKIYVNPIIEIKSADYTTTNDIPESQSGDLVLWESGSGTIKVADRAKESRQINVDQGSLTPNTNISVLCTLTNPMMVFVKEPDSDEIFKDLDLEEAEQDTNRRIVVYDTVANILRKKREPQKSLEGIKNSTTLSDLKKHLTNLQKYEFRKSDYDTVMLVQIGYNFKTLPDTECKKILKQQRLYKIRKGQPIEFTSGKPILVPEMKILQQLAAEIQKNMTNFSTENSTSTVNKENFYQSNKSEITRALQPLCDTQCHPYVQRICDKYYELPEGKSEIEILSQVETWFNEKSDFAENYTMKAHAAYINDPSELENLAEDLATISQNSQLWSVEYTWTYKPEFEQGNYFEQFMITKDSDDLTKDSIKHVENGNAHKCHKIIQAIINHAENNKERIISEQEDFALDVDKDEFSNYLRDEQEFAQEEIIEEDISKAEEAKREAEAAEPVIGERSRIKPSTFADQKFVENNSAGDDINIVASNDELEQEDNLERLKTYKMETLKKIAKELKIPISETRKKLADDIINYIKHEDKKFIVNDDDYQDSDSDDDLDMEIDDNF